MELTREDIEDMMYLRLLSTMERLADDGKPGHVEIARQAGRLLRRARGMSHAPDDGKRAIVHTRDQTRLHELRREIGDAVVELGRQLV